MHIVTCIKQTPATDNVQIDPETGTLKREGMAAAINPFDEYALEEGLRIREKHSGKVILLSMGPEGAMSALREGLSLGADEAVLCCDPVFDSSDTNATAKILAKAIAKIGSVASPTNFRRKYCGYCRKWSRNVYSKSNRFSCATVDKYQPSQYIPRLRSNKK